MQTASHTHNLAADGKLGDMWTQLNRAYLIAQLDPHTPISTKFVSSSNVRRHCHPALDTIIFILLTLANP